MDKMVFDGGPFPQPVPNGPYFDPDLTSNISVITGNNNNNMMLVIIYNVSHEICHFLSGHIYICFSS